jgi:hypothetical protein
MENDGQVLWLVRTMLLNGNDTKLIKASQQSMVYIVLFSILPIFNLGNTIVHGGFTNHMMKNKLSMVFVITFHLANSTVLKPFVHHVEWF